MNITRYHLSGINEDVDRYAILEALRKQPFAEIEGSFEMNSVGFVLYDDMLSTDFTLESLFPADHSFLRFGLRIDQRKINGRIFRKRLEERLRKDREEWEKANAVQKSLFDGGQDKPQEYRLSNDRKREIREQVKLEIAAKTLPEPELANVVINLKTGEALLFSTKAAFRKAAITMFQYITSELAVEMSPPELLQLMGYELPEKPVGSAFLTWLWGYVERRKEEFLSLNGEEVAVNVVGAVKLEQSVDGTTESLTAAGPLEKIEEIEIALRRGRQIVQATLEFELPSGEFYLLTVKSGEFTFALKTPKLDRSDKEDPNGLFFEELYLVKQALAYFDELFARYLAQAEIPHAGGKIRSWHDPLLVHLREFRDHLKEYGERSGAEKVTIGFGGKEVVVYEKQPAGAEA